MSRVAEALRRAAAGVVPAGAHDRAALPEIVGHALPANPWDLDGERDVVPAPAPSAPHARRPIDIAHGPADRRFERRREPVIDEGSGPAPGPNINTIAERGNPGVRGEEYQDLVQRLFRPGTGEPAARAVLFIEFDPAGGGGQVVADVSHALAAHRAGSLCVVDASFGSSSLNAHFDVPPGQGLCDALLSSTPPALVALQTLPDVWLVPSGGSMLDHPSWVPATTSRMLRQLASRFDYVIVAASARHTSMATLVALAAASDGVVLVIQTDRTRRDEAAALVSRLHEGGTAVLGAVLSDRAPGPAQ